MCGICGIVDRNAQLEHLERAIAALSQPLQHRGPDGHGQWIGESCGLGHRRLAILDLAGGAQPMTDPRGFVLSFNGEIYNFAELREELISVGEIFETRSDSEVLLKAYIRWGEGCLEKLNGMFAFAIWDTTRQRLFLARDPIGIKTLYYTRLGECLAFASEIKGLLALAEVDRRPDLRMIPFYLGSGYMPRQHTGFREIHQLLPGHWLTWSEGQVRSGCYWDVGAKAAERGVRRCRAEDMEELVALIRDALRLQVVADVPVGVFLSGGIDSGIVTALLAETASGSIKTFTVGFQKSGIFDEGRVAASVAERFGTEHHALDADPKDLLSHWERLFDHFDLPFADDSALPTFLISRFARDRVKVILSGDGGDEQWGGYQSYRRYLQLSKAHGALPPMLRRLVAGAAGGATRLMGSRSRLGRRLGFAAGVFRQTPERLYMGLQKHMNGVTMRDLAGDRLRPHLADPEIAQLMSSDHAGGLDAVMRHDVGLFMVDDVLRKVDMMSMLASLEVRVPLLDLRVVEKSLAISWRDKISATQTKTLMRTYFADRLPKDVVEGRKKGFAIPLDEWLRGPLRQSLEDTLLGERARQRGVLRAKEVARLVSEHSKGVRSHGKLLLDLLVLERWLCRHDA
ncbi:MAG: asparagine synthase (glutamine-hydrolyzing) [Rhodospirillales bacterium]|nr:asparagine synthase (glutamine-hydrolyzing) [Rhodospirillales bacterium]